MRYFLAITATLILLAGPACSTLEPQGSYEQVPATRSREPSRTAEGPLIGLNDWEFSVGAGAVALPAYLGSDTYQLWALPLITAKRGRFFLSPLAEGTGYNLVNNGTWRAGPLLKFASARREDGKNSLRVAGNTSDDLRGLGDVDATIEVGGFAEIRANSLVGKLEVRQGLGGHGGLLAELGLWTQHRIHLLGKQGLVSIGPELVAADSNYLGSYFDVNMEQSVASGLPEFEARSGLVSWGLGSSVAVSITERISLAGFATYRRLLGDAEDSSLVKERGSEDHFVSGITLRYRF